MIAMGARSSGEPAYIRLPISQQGDGRQGGKVSQEKTNQLTEAQVVIEEKGWSTPPTLDRYDEI